MQATVFSMAASDDADIRQQLAELSSRVASLEATIAVLEGNRGAGPQQQPAQKMKYQLRGRVGAAKPEVSLERRIGAQLLNRIGILATLTGMAWFLKLAFDRNWIGPSVRIWIGLAAAAGVVAWSERFRRRGFPAFAYSLKALGSSIAYLSLWAAASLFHLAPLGLVFLAMTGVTVFNAMLAHRQDSELLGLYALAGGLATPGLLSIGHSEIFLFSYLALLNVGALLLLALHPWKRMAWAALLGTAFYYVAWCWEENDPSHFLPTVLFLGLFFAGFTAAPWLQKVISAVAFPIANAAATWFALMALFAAGSQHSWRPWVTLALAGGCLVIAFASRRLAALAQTNLALAIFFATVAVPLEFHGTNLILCWLGESLVLVILARLTSHPIPRIFATAVLTLVALALLTDWAVGTPQPLAVVTNSHFVTNIIAAMVFAAVTILSLGAGSGRRFGSWNYLAAFSAYAFSVTLLIAVSLEIHHYWFCGAGFFRDFCGGYGQLERRTIAAGWGYSAWCMAYGAAVMTVGFLRRSAFLRWQALVVLAFSIAKVFLNGVSQQSQGYRVLSFLALGALLLAISFAYQKDWLRLRG
ncbi:MAG: DUF2339 domain-containing protein [Acidobacteriaceae bacterium]